MNVSYAKLEARLDSVLAKFQVRRLNNQLITSEYISSLLQTIQNALDKDKKVKLFDVALRSDIDLGYLKQLVFEHFADDFKQGLSFDVESSFLFSKDYFRLVQAKVSPGAA